MYFSVRQHARKLITIFELCTLARRQNHCTKEQMKGAKGLCVSLRRVRACVCALCGGDTVRNARRGTRCANQKVAPHTQR